MNKTGFSFFFLAQKGPIRQGFKLLLGDIQWCLQFIRLKY